MKIDKAGKYTLTYKAVDLCGNESTATRLVVVEPQLAYRTVLYADGTFIINESSYDEEYNTVIHGEATNVYAPFDPNGTTDAERYIFTGSTNRPWDDKSSLITTIKIGSIIAPTHIEDWFNHYSNCVSMNLKGLDTSAVTFMNGVFLDCELLKDVDISEFNTSAATDMSYMFSGCEALESIDLSNFDTSSVELMTAMFSGCQNLTSLDLTSFDTHSVKEMGMMFIACKKLESITVSKNFDVAGVERSESMFTNMSSNLVGEEGTTWSASNPTDKTYAHIDGGTSDPGYFTGEPKENLVFHPYGSISPVTINDITFTFSRTSREITITGGSNLGAEFETGMVGEIDGSSVLPRALFAGTTYKFKGTGNADITYQLKDVNDTVFMEIGENSVTFTPETTGYYNLFILAHKETSFNNVTITPTLTKVD